MRGSSSAFDLIHTTVLLIKLDSLLYLLEEIFTGRRALTTISTKSKNEESLGCSGRSAVGLDGRAFDGFQAQTSLLLNSGIVKVTSFCCIGDICGCRITLL